VGARWMRQALVPSIGRMERISKAAPVVGQEEGRPAGGRRRMEFSIEGARARCRCSTPCSTPRWSTSCARWSSTTCRPASTTSPSGAGRRPRRDRGPLGHRLPGLRHRRGAALLSEAPSRSPSGSKGDSDLVGSDRELRPIECRRPCARRRHDRIGCPGQLARMLRPTIVSESGRAGGAGARGDAPSSSRAARVLRPRPQRRQSLRPGATTTSGRHRGHGNEGRAPCGRVEVPGRSGTRRARHR